MARTDAAAVRGVLNRDYDSRRSPSLAPYIRAASIMVNRMVECATRKGFTHTSDELVEIETWVAAWMYVGSDATYSSLSDIRGSGSVNKTEDSYLRRAQAMDGSGCLSRLTAKGMDFDWVGKTETEQLDYDERN